MKIISRKEAEQILKDYGHQMHVTVPIKLHTEDWYKSNETGDEWIQEEWQTVLDNAMVYNPYGKKQYGMSSNEKNAANAMKFIKDRFKIYSSVFGSTTGEYKIED